MNKWERKLRREGLGPKVGRRTLHMSRYDEHINPTHGLVSPVYALSAPGDYWEDGERTRRCRVALRGLIQEYGKDTVWLRIKRVTLPAVQEPIRARVLETLEGLADTP